MSQELITSCIDPEPKSLIVYEFDSQKITRNLCQNCINFIKNSRFGKIISESALKEESK